MTHILAITIGPIFDTLQQARKTRELWAASYLYSHLTGLLMAELEKIGGKIILPRPIEDGSKPRYGAGIYNDRLFADIGGGDLSKVDTAIQKAIDRLAADVTVEGADTDQDFWQKFLRVKWTHKTIESLTDGALFKQMDPLLNAAELHRPYFCDAPEKDRLTELLVKVYETRLAKSALTGDAKGIYAGMMKGLFPSTVDLATFELFQRKPEEYYRLGANEDMKVEELDQFYEEIFAETSPFAEYATDYHKYFCIVHADGDNLGALNRTLKDEESYRGLSVKLADFALKAAGIVNAYGGKPVYIGGDDLLFFAPVCAVKQDKTVSVFQMIAELDEAYRSLGFEGTSLSFGITISYYKFPLFEARQLSYEQLAGHAKKVYWEKGGCKDAVAFRLLKHSGAYFEGILSKSVLSEFVSSETSLRQGDKDLISGVVFKMETLAGLFDLLFDNHKLDARIEPLFENYFNEPVHVRNKTQLELIRKLLAAVYRSRYKIDDHSGSHTKNLFAILRLLKFVTDRPERNNRSRIPTATANTSLFS